MCYPTFVCRQVGCTLISLLQRLPFLQFFVEVLQQLLFGDRCLGYAVLTVNMAE